MKLSEHFTLDEMTASDAAQRRGWDNTPNADHAANLMRLAAFLERVRIVLGNKPISITSGYRCKLVNDSVGSKDTSQHRYGCAADIRVVGMTPRQVCEAIIKSKLEYDQVILEFNSWTHVSIPLLEFKPRRSGLIIDSAGTRLYS
jgi:uncharacterized protein YcbK (DUF882 family)